MKIIRRRKKILRRVLSSNPSDSDSSSSTPYKGKGYGYGGYGGGKKYVPPKVTRPLRTGKPVTIPFRQQRLSKSKPYDPKGIYVVWVDEDIADGVIKLRNPLVLPWGAAAGPKSWSVKLKQKFKAWGIPYKANGSYVSSRILREKGYDGIITLGGPRLSQKQLDLFYNTDIFQKQLKGRPYQIVIFREGQAKFLKSPDPEEILDRYFALSPKLEVKNENSRVWSESLGEYIDIKGVDQVVSEQEELIKAYKGEILKLKKERDKYLYEKTVYKDALESFDKISQSIKGYQPGGSGPIEQILNWGASLDDSQLKNLIESLIDTDWLDRQDIDRALNSDGVDGVKSEVIDLLITLETHGDLDEVGLDLDEALKDSEEKSQDAFDQIKFRTGIVKYRSGMLVALQKEMDTLKLKNSVSEDLLIELSGVKGLPKVDAQGNTLTYDVSIRRETEDGIIKVSVEGKYISRFGRSINIKDGVIENDYLILSKQAPSGLGTRLLYSQALSAKKEGFKKISCYAAEGTEYIGYYTWARLGYSADIDVAVEKYLSTYREKMKEDLILETGITPPGTMPDLTETEETLLGESLSGLARRRIRRRRRTNMEKWWNSRLTPLVLPSMIRDGFFPEYITLDTPLDNIEMSDLMMTDKGASWWKEHGTGWDAEFDLQDQPNGEPSRSMQVISSYVKLKQKARGKEIDKWASEREGTAEINLTPEDFEILDIVWDKLREKETKKWRRGLL